MVNITQEDAKYLYQVIEGLYDAKVKLYKRESEAVNSNTFYDLPLDVKEIDQEHIKILHRGVTYLDKLLSRLEQAIDQASS